MSQSSISQPASQSSNHQPVSQPSVNLPVNQPSIGQSFNSQAASHPNSPSVSQTFLQYNCNGLRHSSAELNSFLQKSGVKVACLQETKLSSTTKSPFFANYTVLRRDRPTGRGGGLAILVHHSVLFTHIDSSSIFPGDGTAELLGISATINGSPIIVLNV